MNDWSEEDAWLSRSEDFQRLFSEAIALVLRDAEAVLGKGVVTHVVDPDEEAFLRDIGPDVERPPGHLMILGHSGCGFSWHSDMTWPDYVVSAAEGIQEALFEGDDFWGIAFPPCSVHPNHPLNPEVVDGRVYWKCPRGSVEPIEIGKLAVSGGSESDQ